VISPEKINQEVILQEIQKWGAEVAVVVAYGQILSNAFLALFPFGAVNVHGSILPRWRGAAPIQRALQAGDTECGVTLQKIVKELDAGDIIGLRRIALSSEITALELHDELAVLGADLLHVELMDYVRGNLAPTPQSSEGITYAKKIEKSECQIDWRKSAIKIHNQIRGFLMGPGSFSILTGKKYKLHRTQVLSSKSGGASEIPGKILKASGEDLHIQTGEGILAVLEIQPESRSKMKVGEFLKSTPFSVGDLFDGLS
jgi:methionyl-tRNA formyltransferase